MVITSVVKDGYPRVDVPVLTWNSHKKFLVEVLICTSEHRWWSRMTNEFIPNDHDFQPTHWAYIPDPFDTEAVKKTAPLIEAGLPYRAVGCFAHEQLTPATHPKEIES